MYEKYAKFRDERGMNDFAVSKATGIAPATFTDWKQGKSTPKVDKLKAIADLFDVKIEDLI